LKEKGSCELEYRFPRIADGFFQGSDDVFLPIIRKMYHHDGIGALIDKLVQFGKDFEKRGLRNKAIKRAVLNPHSNLFDQPCNFVSPFGA
jgi:hypothetical protein